MEKFLANTLIFYLKSQQTIGYRGIDEMLAIIDDDDLKDEIKREQIFAAFHKYGLFETTIHKGAFKPAESVINEITEAEAINGELRIDMWVIKARHGKVKIKFPLN
jgi:hypothetical protein